jgi:small subunit ribosomal protein S4
MAKILVRYVNYAGVKVKNYFSRAIVALLRSALSSAAAFAPGQHGKSGGRGRGGMGRESDYGRQLRAKQRARRVYGVLGTSVPPLLRNCAGRHGLTGLNLLQILESRMDNVVYRLGFASSRAQARLLVTHGHFTVNGRRTDVPSMLLSPGDAMQVPRRFTQACHISKN